MEKQNCKPDVEPVAPQLSVRNITKTFPGVVALSDVSIDIARGEIHAVIGENGAGKSTLMHIIAGVYSLEKGEMSIQGIDYKPRSEGDAQTAGIAMVYQEGSLFEPLSVAENIFAGRQPEKAKGIIDFQKMYAESKTILSQLECDIKPTDKVSTLSPGQCQLVEIAKALSQNVKLLILDEPTSSLTISEARHLFKVVRSLAQKGVSILYVSHRLPEIFEIADKATVLKDGKLMGTKIVSETNASELIQLQVGRELTFEKDMRRVAKDAPIVLNVKDVSAPAVKNASLTVKAGEIVCLAGLVGAGRTELCEAIFGSREILSGTIEINGKAYSPKHPRDAMEAGIGMVPEDRRESGLFVTMSIEDNVLSAKMEAVTKTGVINNKKITQIAEEQRTDLRVASPDVKRQVMYLSGGNQQKVLFGKWLVREPQLLIVDEPTRGVDVGSKSDMYAIIRKRAEAGAAVLVVSSDLPEVLSLAHRIVVMSEGRTVGEIDAYDADEYSILQMATPAAEA